MAEPNVDRLFEALIAEYERLHAELSLRTTLQNQMSERGLSLTFLTAGLLSTLMTFLQKDFGEAHPEITLIERYALFQKVAIPVLIVHGILIQLTVAAWVFHLAMRFRITRYWNWVSKTHLSKAIDHADSVFLWDRVRRNMPWELEFERGALKYFQVAFLYALVGLSGVSVALAAAWAFATPGSRLIAWSAVVGFVILAVGTIVIMSIHYRVHFGGVAAAD